MDYSLFSSISNSENSCCERCVTNLKSKLNGYHLMGGCGGYCRQASDCYYDVVKLSLPTDAAKKGSIIDGQHNIYI